MLAAALLALWPFPVLALRLLGWLAAPVRIIIRRRDYIPARLALPVASIYARFGRFPPFWRRFGVAVVSNAGAVSLRPFRWCRCAYKVAKTRGLALPLSLTPSDISPTNYSGYIPRHTGAPCEYLRRPRFVYACGRLAGGVRWLSRRVSLGGVLSRGRRIIIRQHPARPCVGGGIAPPPRLPFNLSNNFPPMLAAGGRAGYRAPPMV